MWTRGEVQKEGEKEISEGGGWGKGRWRIKKEIEKHDVEKKRGDRRWEGVEEGRGEREGGGGRDSGEITSKQCHF